MDPRAIHYGPTAALPAPDPSWLEDDQPEQLVRNPRFGRWDDAPEQPWEEFSLSHVAGPATAPSQEAPVYEQPVYVQAKPFDDTFEQSLMMGGVALVLVVGMCTASAFLGFLVGLLVAS